ncbi:hypothetical protein FRC11_007071 [Ceratobasidium sp. 423]|nr:hypothetical protein FRC11_007071 [Ceratobasidium sp. 423]
MIEELRAASERFCVALEQYVHACSTIQRAFPQGVTLRNTPSDWAARLDQELGQFGSYGTQLQQAELAIKLTRNYTFDIVPINRLPAEILARIFQMVRDINPHLRVRSGRVLTTVPIQAKDFAQECSLELGSMLCVQGASL